jgi:hypothetical protein
MPQRFQASTVMWLAELVAESVSFSSALPHRGRCPQFRPNCGCERQRVDEFPANKREPDRRQMIDS